MLTYLDNYYEQQAEPVRGCLLALRAMILAADKEVTAAWKYGMPFFCYRGKMFCYLWVHKKTGQPYLGIVEGKHFDEAFLIQEKRSRMKILMLDADQDLPVERIKSVIEKSLSLYRSGIVATPIRK